MDNGRWTSPPMNPRDIAVMVADRLYTFKGHRDSVMQLWWEQIREHSWPTVMNYEIWENLPRSIRERAKHKKTTHYNHWKSYRDEWTQVWSHMQRVYGTEIKPSQWVNGAMTTRVGRDLYFGTTAKNEDPSIIRQFCQREFPDYRTHVIETGGHADGTFCPVCPGLIVSLADVPTYAETFPGWEVVYLPYQSWSKIRPFLDLKKANNGRWWIPGFEYDREVINVVESWLTHWVGYVEETVFDVNMLVIDEKNVMVFNHNDKVMEAFDRRGITAHIVPFRHRYFWDGGIHCVTLDLKRRGEKKDYFPERS